MDFGLSPRGRDYLERTRAFMAEQIEPVEGNAPDTGIGKR